MSRAVVFLVLLAGCGADPADDAYSRARAALVEGKQREAVALVEGAEGDHAVFLRGNLAFAECLSAERQASTPAAEPFAWDVAIAYGDKALGFWREVAVSRDDWPAARRNVERALLKIDELKRKKAAAEEKKRRQADPNPKPRPRPKPKPKPQPEPDEKEDENDPQTKALSPADVAKLIDRLAEKEREKVALRRAERRTRAGAVERDW